MRPLRPEILEALEALLHCIDAVADELPDTVPVELLAMACDTAREILNKEKTP